MKQHPMLNQSQATTIVLEWITGKAILSDINGPTVTDGSVVAVFRRRVKLKLLLNHSLVNESLMGRLSCNYSINFKNLIEISMNTHSCTTTFIFKVKFLDEDERLLFSERARITVPATDHPEGDREEAGDRLETWAEEELESNGAESYEYELVDVG
jgi:hypothetical protein